MRPADPRTAVASTVAALSLLVGGCGGGEETGEAGAAGVAGLTATEPFEVAVAADIGIERTGRATLAEMGEAGADLNLALGDLSYAGPGSEPEFCELVGSLVGEEAPVALLAGNHEDDTGGDGSIANFAECLPDRVGAVGDYGVQYYFDVGRLARFVMISPDLTVDGRYYYFGPDDDGQDTPELAWLKEALAGAREAGIRWTIVGMHKPCISVGEYYCDVYQDLFTTLIEERVDLVLSGHDHSYQRSKQLAVGASCPEVTVDDFDRRCVADAGDALERGRGTVFMVAGMAGGEELYPVHADDPEAGYFATAMGRNSPSPRDGFVELRLTSASLEAAFVGSTPGRFGDSFAIRR